MKAFIPETEVSKGRNLAGHKELIDQKVVAVVDEGVIKTPITVRWYTGRRGGTIVHCCIWVQTKDGRYFSGYGSVGGYGYHKISAAFQEALDSCGIELQNEGKLVSIAGRGDSAVDEALLEILEAAGWEWPCRIIV